MKMRMGNWSLNAIPTGDFALDGGAMFGVVPRVLWSRDHPPDDENRIDMTMRALLLTAEIDGQERVVLVDTGAGGKLTPKLQAIYRVDHSQHDLVGGLAAAGYTPGQVTDVILTHLHFDHAGGATRFAEDAPSESEDTPSESEDTPSKSVESRNSGFPAAVPAFPNAVYHVQQRQWEWANDPSPRDRASFFPENFLPIKESGQLNLVEGEVELFPDLFLLVVDGHTPAQQLPLIRTVKSTFLYCGDLFPTHSHIRLPWVMAYDLEPLKTLHEKMRVLPQAAEEEWVLFFEHDARTECCHVEEVGGDFVASEPFDLETCS